MCASEVILRYKRAHILLPEDLARDIDAIAGRRGRSAFLVQTAREAVRRRKLLNFLKNEEPAWKDSDHPDMPGDSAVWVRELRKSSGKRSRVRAGQRKGEPKQS
jgi:hypothetical protein